MRVRYRELALADLDGIFRYLNERSPAGARNVTDAIHAAIATIPENPFGARRTSDPAVYVKIGRYGYEIFYAVEAETVEILHVRHGSRRPWSIE
ncbi:MAG: type II toxin-antitoxin system RelE/ParE family toxin [Hyphomicrobiales bacterium]|nr:type II toxin-antitoxin system RelE/ParE family toxin [Hyphomicrobiales bacterium]